MSELAQMLKQKNSPYLQYAKNIVSQNGEDGIIEKLFEDLDIEDCNVVEFGAWDGVYLSNVYNLWRYKNFNALLREGNKEVNGVLSGIEAKYKNVEFVNTYVSPNGADSDSLDSILWRSKFKFNDDNFALLSIDVDGLDYDIWDSLNMFKPKIVICETNWQHTEEYKGADGCSLKTLTQLANKKGYRLVCHNLNGFYVREDLYEKEFDNSVENMQVDLDDICTLQKTDENGNLMNELRCQSKGYYEFLERERNAL